MPSPVLELIEQLLVTQVKNPLQDENVKCRGTKEGGQQCRDYASNRVLRDAARVLKDRFMAMNAVPYDEGFYEDVKLFIQCHYCTSATNLTKAKPHAAPSLEAFDDWARKRPVADQGSSPSLYAATNGASWSEHEVKTPRKHVAAAHLEADRPSPGSVVSNTDAEESIFDLSHASPASPASTAISTPGSALPRVLPVNTVFQALDDDDSGDWPDPDAVSDSDWSDDGVDLDEVDYSILYEAPDRVGTPTRKPRKRNAIGSGPPIALRDPSGIVRIPRRQLTPEQRHRDLLEAIRKPFGETDLKHGRVYIWTHKDPNNPKIKVGFTKRTSEMRRNDRKACYAMDTNEHWESDEAFVGAFRVKKIVHKHLQEWNSALTICKRCTRLHREWFEKDVGEVRAVVEDWTKFARVAYRDGMLSEAANRAVTERIVDMQPNIADLVAFIASAAAEATIPSSPELVPVAAEGTAARLTSASERPPGPVRESEQISSSPVPCRASLDFEDAISRDSIPAGQAAGVAARGKPRRRDINRPGKTKYKTKQVRDLSHGQASSSDQDQLPASTDNGTSDGNGDKNKEIKQIFDQVLSRYQPELERLERGPSTLQPEQDVVSMREKVTSWKTRLRKAVLCH
jgi:hypothetical protein